MSHFLFCAIGRPDLGWVHPYRLPLVKISLALIVRQHFEHSAVVLLAINIVYRSLPDNARQARLPFSRLLDASERFLNNLV